MHLDGSASLSSTTRPRLCVRRPDSCWHRHGHAHCLPLTTTLDEYMWRMENVTMAFTKEKARRRRSLVQSKSQRQDSDLLLRLPRKHSALQPQWHQHLPTSCVCFWYVETSARKKATTTLSNPCTESFISPEVADQFVISPLLRKSREGK